MLMNIAIDLLKNLKSIEWRHITPPYVIMFFEPSRVASSAETAPPYFLVILVKLKAANLVPFTFVYCGSTVARFHAQGY